LTLITEQQVKLAKMVKEMITLRNEKGSTQNTETLAVLNSRAKLSTPKNSIPPAVAQP